MALSSGRSNLSIAAFAAASLLTMEVLAGAAAVRGRTSRARTRSTFALASTVDPAVRPLPAALPPIEAASVTSAASPAIPSPGAVTSTRPPAIASTGPSSIATPQVSLSSPVACDAPPPRATDFSLEDPSVELGARTGIVQRSLDFTQDIYGRMRALRTTLYVARFDAAVYPTIRTADLGRRLGLMGRFEHVLAGHVRDVDFQTEFEAYHWELSGGLRFRQPVRQHRLGFELIVNRLSSGLVDGAAAGTPDVRYTEARAGVDGTVDFKPFRISAGAGFRAPLSYGELGDREWFPRVSGYGLDALASLSYALSPLVSVDVSASLRRYVLEMNSEPEDGASGISETAGGAVDSYAGAYIGLSFLL